MPRYDSITRNEEDDDDDISLESSAALEVFRGFLTANCTFQRRPKTIQKFRQDTENSDSNSAHRIFLEAGRTAWFAYFLALRSTDGGTHHFSGRKKMTETMRAFHTLPVEDQKRVAEKVAAINPHATVQEAMRIMGLENASMWLLHVFKQVLIWQRLGAVTNITHFF